MKWEHNCIWSSFSLMSRWCLRRAFVPIRLKKLGFYSGLLIHLECRRGCFCLRVITCILIKLQWDSVWVSRSSICTLFFVFQQCNSQSFPCRSQMKTLGWSMPWWTVFECHSFETLVNSDSSESGIKSSSKRILFHMSFASILKKVNCVNNYGECGAAI